MRWLRREFGGRGAERQDRPAAASTSSGGITQGNEPRTQGIVLAGSYEWDPSSLERFLPKPLLPVAHAPVICYALRWMQDGGISRATICTNSATRAVRAFLGEGSTLGMSLDHVEDWRPRGPAGCVRDAGVRRNAETFVIVDGTVIPTVDLGELLQTHFSTRAAVTLVVHREEPDGPFSPGGIYVFDRRSLDFIPNSGFQDIKERLIPNLYRAGQRVVTHVGRGACPRVVNAETYLAINEWAIGLLADQATPAGARALPASTAVIEATASVDPTATLVGPVLVGPFTRIEAGAVIVGPSVLGPECRVGKGALVSRTVAWTGCVVGEEAVVDRSILVDDVTVGARERLCGLLKAPNGDGSRRARSTSTVRGLGALAASGWATLRRWADGSEDSPGGLGPAPPEAVRAPSSAALDCLKVVTGGGFHGRQIGAGHDQAGLAVGTRLPRGSEIPRRQV